MYFDRKKDFFGFKTYCYSFKGYFKEASCHRFTKKSIIKNHSNSAKKLTVISLHTALPVPFLNGRKGDGKQTSFKLLKP